ncbi:C39 family peptidase [Oceanobacillus senegalensis]|uniref:C39 family peptidase n=1 Tax=Oceanobacillus senegalensis TaxID=1936063 RepID=UPI001C4E716F|nr:C39 family peptidase [Oceanobacillus senegalensis]
MIQLNVPVIGQLPELPTGCEITAVTMMLQYKGVSVDKITLANEMPRASKDPDLGYVGDPFTPDGWTIYPTALVELVKRYCGSSVNLTGTDGNELEKHLSNGKPIVVLVSPMHRFTVHAITITGYDEQFYFYNDPWTAKKDVKMKKEKFYQIWEKQNKRALTY